MLEDDWKAKNLPKKSDLDDSEFLFFQTGSLEVFLATYSLIFVVLGYH